MVNSKKYDDSNPRVVISTRKNIRDWVRKRYPESKYNTDHKKLTKLKEEVEHDNDTDQKSS